MSDDETVERLMRLVPPWLAAIAAVDDQIAREMGIGTSDLTCWHEVVTDGPLPAGALARRLRLTTGAITRLVDRLVAAGAVRRVPDEGDRRRVLIASVPEAEARIMGRYTELGERLRGTLAGFSAEERAVVARFFEASLRDTRSLLD